MAAGAVGFLLSKVDCLLVEERKLLSGVLREVEEIKDELESVQAFITDADAREEDDQGVKIWVKQVRELACDTEDALAEFVFHSAQQPHPRSGFVGFVYKTTHFIKHWKAHHRLATRLQNIKKRASNISERSKRYNFNRSDGASSSSTRHDPRGDEALLIEEAQLVGINQPRNDLIRFLLEEEPRLVTVSVVGMAGLGKTTLVKKVYDDHRVKGYFQNHAWITVSQSFQTKEILRDLIEQLFDEIQRPVPHGLDSLSHFRLKEMLKEFLQQKRYVIVFDDIWSIGAWDGLKYGLPDSNCGSRIMITTRFIDVASSCNESYGHVYNLNPLSPEEAWVLFRKKAFRSNLENNCPPELVLLSQNILSRCKGLPLAIVAIGGLLLTKDNTVIEWRRVFHSLGAELESNSRLESMMKILLLSYNDLPYHLKSCYLYLSVFPEDYPIGRKRLIWLWVAEGLVEEKQGITAEEVAECYLNEFYKRSLIQPANIDHYGFVKEWRVHDVMREIILLKSRDQNYTTVVAEDEPLKLPRKIRRLSIHKSNKILIQMQSKSENYSCIRSLLVFDTSVCVFLQFSRLLRVLDLKGAPLEVFPDELVNLFHLRFLSLRGTKIKMIPKFIGNLRNLETLDLKYTYVSEFPGEILKLQRLRHLLACDVNKKRYPVFEFHKGCKVPRGIGSLGYLQTLTSIEGIQGIGMIRELGRLTQLRTLGISKLSTEDGIFLCASIEKMSNLRYLGIIALQKEDLIDLQSISSPPPLLRRLEMSGRLENLPHWISSLHNLVKINFGWSRLSVDPLEALQALPNLLSLYLHHAYDGEELCFQAGGFQRLKVLQLSELDGLRVVRVEKKAMSHLEFLYIKNCSLLEKAPLGIEDIGNLKQLYFYEMPNEFEMKLIHNGCQDHWRTAHIPIVAFMHWRDGNWELYRP